MTLHDEPTVSDGERDEMVSRLRAASKRHIYYQSGVGPLLAEAADMIAGYRKALMVSVEDVARIINGYDPGELNFPNNQTRTQWQHSLDKATAVLALLEGGRRG